MDDGDNKTPDAYPADKARQAKIELRRPWQRVVFISGLVGVVVLAAITRAFGVW